MTEKSFSVPGKIIFENFSPNTHKAEIHKETDLGVFEGVVVTHPEDYDIENGYLGLSYAERKCDLAYHKKLAEKLADEAEGVYKAWQSRIAETGMPDEILAEAATKAQAEADEQLAFVKKATKKLYRFFANDEKEIRESRKEYDRLMKKLEMKKEK